MYDSPRLGPYRECPGGDSVSGGHRVEPSGRRKAQNMYDSPLSCPLFGCAGNDVLVGGSDVDSMWGDDGNDKFRAADSGTVDFLRGGNGSDTAPLPGDDDANRDSNDSIPDEDIENL